MTEICQIQAGLTDDEVADLVEMSDGDSVSLDAIAEAKLIAKEKETAALIQIDIIQKRMSDQASHSKGMYAGLVALLTRDPTEKGTFVSLQGRINHARGGAHLILNDMMHELRTNLKRNIAAIAGGHIQTAEQRSLSSNIVKALHGEKASADGAAMAKAWSKTIDMMRGRMAKALGVRLERLDSWRLPQNHDNVAVGKAGFDDWFDFIDGKLDHDQMDIGSMSLAERKELLNGIYDNIRTQGISSMTGEGAAQAVANNLLSRYNKQRVLHFKDADSWLTYQDKFGSQNIYKTMMDHIDKLSRDIAAAEHFGPNPTKTFNHLKTQVIKEAGDKNAARRPEATFNLLVGKSTGEGGRVAAILPTIRNWNVSTQLNAAFLSSFTDAPIGMVGSVYNDMPAFGQMKRYFKTIATGDDARQKATRLMLSAEYAIDRGLAAHDYTGNMGSIYSQNLAETASKVSFLSPHTEISRAAWGVELSSALTGDTGKSFDQLSSARKSQLKRHGISKEDWEVIRNTEKFTMKGESFIDPVNIPIEQQVKYISMISQETDMAVPTPDARERTLLTLGTKAGSTSGEMIRSAVQYKAHPLHVLISQINRGLVQDTAMGKVTYTSSLIVSMTAMGAIAVQAKELSKGNEIMDWDSPTLWINAMKVGGGLGLFGDFLTNNGVAGYPQSIAQQLAGPTASGAAQGLYDLLAFGNFEKLSEGDFSGFSSSAADFAIRNLPMARMWWARAALERGITDQLKRLSDPDFDRKARKKMTKLRTETGQSQWWKQGSDLPEGLK